MGLLIQFFQGYYFVIIYLLNLLIFQLVIFTFRSIINFFQMQFQNEYITLQKKNEI